MKKGIRILIWVAAIVGLFLLIGAFLPGSVTVARSTSIKAPAPTVYGVLTDLTTYDAWMPWNQIDSNMQKTFGPLTKGKGAWYSWTSEHWKVGEGKLEISEVIPNQSVTTDLVFGGSDEINKANWKLVPGANATGVTWTIHAHFGHNPISRWFGLFAESMIGPDFEKGLAQLKQKIETGELRLPEPKMTVETIKTTPMQVLTILDTAAVMSDIGPVLQKAYGEIGELINKDQLTFTSAPLAWYYSNSAPFVLEAAIPVNKAPANTGGRIKWKTVPAENAIVVHFYGPYEETHLAYTKIQDWLTANNKKAKGAPYDVYVDDPTTKKSMYEVRTDIIQPFE
ncbi:MAG: SRPBCC family protein [Flavipsychrobacter sp.]|nr:SRPBCC family protein [Flavipsychrobacter sp.]